ncbi:hypothetical protein ACIOD2_09125 [Amycolatopsis sp. NPDC088138]|uniref:hypothetical protein n=1 Tax=Amycolatopsis sp. NPDC088138 TaxID=3363938 RepID=UPI00380EF798
MDYAGSTEAEVKAARKRLPVRGADRRAVAHLAGRGIYRPRPSWRASLNGRNAASALITFGGGAVLAVVMAVTASKPIWALSWLGLLTLGAVVVAVYLSGVLGRPVIFALAMATMLIGLCTQYRRRKLPAGDHGTLAVAR